MSSIIISTSNRGNAVSNYFFALADELVRRNHQVCLIVDGNRQSFEKMKESPAIVSWPSKRPTKWKDAKFFFDLLKKNSPDIIIGNFTSVNIMMVVGWLNSIPHRIAWCHTLSSQQEEDSPNSRYYNTLLRIRKQLVYFLSTQLIANSIATSQDVQKTYGISPEKCSVLPFLISDPLLDINKYIKRKLLKIVCVGRLHSSKGQATLIRAVPDIKKVFPEIEVEFIGDGPSKVEYQQLAKLLGVNDICHFVGALDLKEVLEKMASASICVSPSNNEAFGLVNIEAQAVGTPLVASAVDGIMETVLDGETGFLVSVGNSEEFSNKIKQLLNDNSLRSKFSLRARSHFMEKFSIDTNLSKHVSWFENLI